MNPDSGTQNLVFSVAEDRKQNIVGEALSRGLNLVACAAVGQTRPAGSQ